MGGVGVESRSQINVDVDDGMGARRNRDGRLRLELGGDKAWAKLASDQPKCKCEQGCRGECECEKLPECDIDLICKDYKDAN